MASRAAAAALAYAEEQCKALSLEVTLQSSNGPELYVTGGGEEAPAAEEEPTNDELEKISSEVCSFGLRSKDPIDRLPDGRLEQCAQGV